jgi:uncharacterized membrane protein SirB2
MSLAEHYPRILLAHVTLVAVSGVLFAWRGAGVLAGRRWPLQPRWRVAAVVIDTGLLAVGVLLWMLLGLHPLRNAWLGTKLTLLLVYIALGTLALRRARTHSARALAFAAAMICYAFMVSVAIAHHPLGALHAWFG